MDNKFSLKVKKGIRWATFASLSGKGFVFITGIILAHLLTPEKFGLIAVAMSVVLIAMGSTSPVRIPKVRLRR